MVLLWSAQSWGEVDRVGSERMPGGRFVRGVTQSAAGHALTVVGVLIPWFDAQWSGRPPRRQAVEPSRHLARGIPEAPFHTAHEEDRRLG